MFVPSTREPQKIPASDEISLHIGWLRELTAEALRLTKCVGGRGKKRRVGRQILRVGAHPSGRTLGGG
jgi:hypothetical protein